MITAVGRQDPHQVYQLRALVARVLPHLQWRHSGLGMLQAYLLEGASDELRVHIWDPRLRREGIEESGLLHDHRFDMTSHVLAGSIQQVEYNLERLGAWERPRRPVYELHQVVNARKAFAESKTLDGGVSLMPGRYTVWTQSTDIPAGWYYEFPARKFHGTWPDGLTITVVRKQNQGSYPARILAPEGKPVVHAFADTLPPEAWEPILHDAKVALLTAIGH